VFLLRVCHLRKKPVFLRRRQVSLEGVKLFAPPQEPRASWLFGRWCGTPRASGDGRGWKRAGIATPFGRLGDLRDVPPGASHEPHARQSCEIQTKASHGGIQQLFLDTLSGRKLRLDNGNSIVWSGERGRDRIVARNKLCSSSVSRIGS
jgi:hypothetical protein